jgi:hypothetical protein
MKDLCGPTLIRAKPRPLSLPKLDIIVVDARNKFAGRPAMNH